MRFSLILGYRTVFKVTLGSLRDTTSEHCTRKRGPQCRLWTTYVRIWEFAYSKVRSTTVPTVWDMPLSSLTGRTYARLGMICPVLDPPPGLDLPSCGEDAALGSYVRRLCDELDSCGL